MPYVTEDRDDVYTSVSDLDDFGQPDDQFGTRASRWPDVKAFRTALRVASAPGKEGVYDAALHAAAVKCLPASWQSAFATEGPSALRMCGRDCGTCPYPGDGVIQAYNVFKKGGEQKPPDEIQAHVGAEPPRPPRSQSEVVKSVQGALRVKVDGDYGDKTNTALKRWASGKRIANFGTVGPNALSAVYTSLGLTNLQELSVLANVWSVWNRRQAVTPTPIINGYRPPPPAEGEPDSGGQDVQKAGFAGWFEDYWWAIAALAAVAGGYMIWKRRRELPAKAGA